MDHSRLSIPLGEAIFTQRSIRRFKPDSIPLEDIHLILEAASNATSDSCGEVGSCMQEEALGERTRVWFVNTPNGRGESQDAVGSQLRDNLRVEGGAFC